MCECFKKKYEEAQLIAKEDETYWQWICYTCGQIYLEKCKEPIILN